MKRLIPLLLALALALSGCTAASSESAPPEETTPPAEETTNETAPPAEETAETPEATPPAQETTGAAISLETLNQKLLELDPEYPEPLQFGSFGQSMQYAAFDRCEVYVSSGISNIKTILYHRFADDSWQIVELGGRLQGQDILSLTQPQEAPDCLDLSLDGSYFGGDCRLDDFSRQVRWDPATGEVTTLSYDGDLFAEGRYWDWGTWEQTRFDQVTTEGDTVRFTFAVADPEHYTGNGNPYPGVYLKWRYYNGENQDESDDYQVYSVAFQGTQDNLTEAQLSALRQLPGLTDLTVTAVDDPIFQGTVVELTVPAAHCLRASFDYSGIDESRTGVFQLKLEQNTPMFP